MSGPGPDDGSSRKAGKAAGGIRSPFSCRCTVRRPCEHTFVRWDNLSDGADAARRLPGYRDGAVVRSFDAPEALDVRFYEVQARSALNRVPKASRMPFRWTINPYRGCTHACTYCYARPTHTYLDFDARRDFEREIVVKVNLPEVLRTELARPSWKREHVALGTNTDPYQWAESRYRLMPGDLGGAARRRHAVLGADEVAAAAARPGADARAGRAGRLHRQPVGADARRAGLAGDRATHAASAQATRGRGRAQSRRNSDRRARGAADAGRQRRPEAGRADRGARDARRARRTSAASRCTCAARCATSSSTGSAPTGRTWWRAIRSCIARGAYAPPEERRRLQRLVRSDRRDPAPADGLGRLIRSLGGAEGAAAAPAPAPPRPRQPSLF